MLPSGFETVTDAEMRSYAGRIDLQTNRSTEPMTNDTQSDPRIPASTAAGSSLARRIDKQRLLLKREAEALSQRRAAIRKTVQRKAAADRREASRIVRNAAEILGRRLLAELAFSDPAALLMLDAWRSSLDADAHARIERAVDITRRSKT